MSGLSLFGSGLTITEAQGPTYYLGTWNASTNTPTLASSTAPAGPGGSYYIVSVAGTTNLNGITDWTVGDWVIWSGSVWQKLEGGMTSVTVGSTQIAGGTSGRVLYDNAGVLGEMTNTGTGTVNVLQTSPALITPALGIATGTSLAIGGATIGSNALAVTGTVSIDGAVLVGEAANVLAQRNSTSAQTFHVYNTYTNASNYERASLSWATNIFTINAGSALGTGTSRDLYLLGGGTSLNVTSTSINMFRNGTSNSTLFNASGTSMTSTSQLFFRLTPTINQASGTYTILDINPTETAIGAGPHYLIRGRIGAGANVFGVTNSGAIAGASLALGGATIGSNALAVTGTAAVSTSVSSPIFYNAAAGGILFGAQSTTSFFALNNWAAGGTLQGRAGSVIGWGASTTNPDAAAPDTALSRISAGIIGVGTGAAGSIAGSMQMAVLDFGTAGNAGVKWGASSLGLFNNSNNVLAVRNSTNSADANITANAATFSGAVTVPGVTTAALTSTGTFTSGAAAQVGTLTNAPAAGNPTTWIKIIDNGVTRYIPAW